MKVGLPFVEGFFRADGWDWKLIGPSLNAFSLRETDEAARFR